MNSQSFIQKIYERNSKCAVAFPDRVLAHRFIDELFDLLFIPRNTRQNSLEDISKEFELLKHNFSVLIFDVIEDNRQLERISESFFTALPSLYAKLLKDARAILEFDPAAKSLEEVLITYPGFYATAVYRFAHNLHLQGIPLLPRLFCEYAHSKTGIDIHPGATIGRAFFIDHGTGIVIGETAVIGKNVKI